MFETDEYGFLTEDGLVTTLLSDSNYINEINDVVGDYSVTLDSMINIQNFNVNEKNQQYLGIFVDENKILNNLFEYNKIIHNFNFYIVWRVGDADGGRRYEISSYGPHFDSVRVFKTTDDEENVRKNFLITILFNDIIDNGMDNLDVYKEKIKCCENLYNVENLTYILKNSTVDEDFQIFLRDVLELFNE